MIAMMALIGPAASVERDGRCFDNDDNDLGPAGAVRIEDGENPFEGSLLIRKTRKDRCPCSYVRSDRDYLRRRLQWEVLRF